MHENDHIDETQSPFQEEKLQKVPRSFGQPPDPDAVTARPSPPPAPRPWGPDVGTRVLYDIAPYRSGSISSSGTVEQEAARNRIMSEPPLSGGPIDAPASSAPTCQAKPSTVLDASQNASSAAEGLKAAAMAGLQESERQSQGQSGPKVETTSDVIDPALRLERRFAAPEIHSRGPRSSHLTVTTQDANATEIKDESSDDTMTGSPIMRKFAMPVNEGNRDTLPAVQAMSPNGGVVAIPSQHHLPSIRHLTGPLDRLAEEAAQQRAHHPGQPSLGQNHGLSVISNPSPSHMYPYFGYQSAAQPSPITPHPLSGKSPTSTLGDSQHYGSPATSTGMAYFAHRRSSAATNDSGPYAPPPLHSHPSASSSNDSYATATSSADGCSTAHTTPIESGPPAESPSQRILPPPVHGMQIVPPVGTGVFTCDEQGCTAASFSTQYLLSSHKNVHSHDRPHHCPEPGCPRALGGLGFKRKNEMIRHGLVHDSPGFVCPFCPEREHRYPRPDNLQRHVRVHHPEKSKDDALLRTILNAPRPQGGKVRKRRALGGGEEGGES